MTAPEDEEYVLIQIGALNAMIGKTLCPICHERDLAVDRDTRLGLAVKMVLRCCSCSTASSHWSSSTKEGRMEVEAALQLFGRSISKNDLRYTNVICDGDRRTYVALCNDKTYGFIPLTKEDCVNHVQKRMGSALRS
ncbi:hypothetical protein HPB52_012553 [Rhipicephalus sanguineus]|uniref:Mutator-like transposase domain-containing protein n=1 Tax=Rhipicephalus sanguineus TaxID=34632 RepID=A0A9D4SYC9_RHISA|nr:hypothetical protein HPB52_012553 [Rhipicephalus sanguineus]